MNQNYKVTYKLIKTNSIITNTFSDYSWFIKDDNVEVYKICEMNKSEKMVVVLNELKSSGGMHNCNEFHVNYLINMLETDILSHNFHTLIEIIVKIKKIITLLQSYILIEEDRIRLEMTRWIVLSNKSKKDRERSNPKQYNFVRNFKMDNVFALNNSQLIKEFFKASSYLVADDSNCLEELIDSFYLSLLLQIVPQKNELHWISEDISSKVILKDYLNDFNKLRNCIIHRKKNLFDFLFEYNKKYGFEDEILKCQINLLIELLTP